MGSFRRGFATLIGVFAAVLLLHAPLLRLPYFWDEAGYYIPAALDFYHSWLLIPQSTLPTGHTPLVSVYLAMAWHVFGFSALVTRSAMLFLAAATLTSLYALGCCLARREIAAWSALLMGLMPLFFAQSSLTHVDLAAALFTTLAVLFLAEDRPWMFALSASLAVLSKETAVVLLPAAWIYAWRRREAHRPRAILHWVAWALPLLPLAAWTIYYHHATGYWTGNRSYLAYNLYSTLNPARIFWSFLRRLYEVLIGGFNWLLSAGAVLAVWWGRRQSARQKASAQALNDELVVRHQPNSTGGAAHKFLWLVIGLGTIYVLMLSAVGGAILPRYLLPVFPVLILAAVMLLWRLPRWLARALCLATAAGFIAGWFINPPYPFPFEDNLAYADFVRLHQEAARILEDQPGRPRILTAWPASEELVRPHLGYVQRPLRVVPLSGFATDDFRGVRSESFELLYLYSRQWNPPANWMSLFPARQKLQGRYFDYRPQAPDDTLVTRYHLELLRQFERRGQWVRIYAKSGRPAM